MNDAQFELFCSFRDNFRSYCNKLSCDFGEVLIPLQKQACKNDTPEYPLENPVVYNTALDELTKDSQIRLIVIGDNPGKDEQLLKNCKYLVGQSGKIATSFFKNHPEFNVDFRQNAIILNKTPVHTAKTKHLKYLMQNGPEQLKQMLKESQIYMAKKTAELHVNLCKAAVTDNERPDIFLVGYSELKKNGIFTDYKETLKNFYGQNTEEWKRVYVFQHFSMNRFSIDLKDFMQKNNLQDIVKSAHELGTQHKQEIF